MPRAAACRAASCDRRENASTFNHFHNYTTKTIPAAKRPCAQRTQILLKLISDGAPNPAAGPQQVSSNESGGPPGHCFASMQPSCSVAARRSQSTVVRLHSRSLPEAAAYEIVWHCERKRKPRGFIAGFCAGAHRHPHTPAACSTWRQQVAVFCPAPSRGLLLHHSLQ